VFAVTTLLAFIFKFSECYLQLAKKSHPIIPSALLISAACQRVCPRALTVDSFGRRLTYCAEAKWGSVGGISIAAALCFHERSRRTASAT